MAKQTRTGPEPHTTYGGTLPPQNPEPGDLWFDGSYWVVYRRIRTWRNDDIQEVGAWEPVELTS